MNKYNSADSRPTVHKIATIIHFHAWGNPSCCVTERLKWRQNPWATYGWIFLTLLSKMVRGRCDECEDALSAGGVGRHTLPLEKSQTNYSQRAPLGSAIPATVSRVTWLILWLRVLIITGVATSCQCGPHCITEILLFFWGAQKLKVDSWLETEWGKKKKISNAHTHTETHTHTHTLQLANTAEATCFMGKGQQLHLPGAERKKKSIEQETKKRGIAPAEVKPSLWISLNPPVCRNS